MKNIYTKYRIRYVLSLLTLGLLIFSHSDYHLDRNKNNKLPEGKLTLTSDNYFIDENGSIWELQPNHKNEFHQPNGILNPVMMRDISIPYSILSDPPKLNKDYPYLKLLCEREDGSSYEAILTPDNKYITSATIRGTLNYASPKGIWGNVKHTFIDVIPHFICSDYE